MAMILSVNFGNTTHQSRDQVEVILRKCKKIYKNLFAGNITSNSPLSSPKVCKSWNEALADCVFSIYIMNGILNFIHYLINTEN
jgi:hypothetical protein